MTDVLTKEQRSYNMSQIKGKNTKIELILRKHFRAHSMNGYRIHSKKIFGKPDIIFSKRKIAIFIDGCQWHKCRVHYIQPKTRVDFWIDKIEGNVKRDKIVNTSLKASGWHVIRLWEHDLKKKTINKALDRLIMKMKEVI